MNVAESLVACASCVHLSEASRLAFRRPILTALSPAPAESRGHQRSPPPAKHHNHRGLLLCRFVGLQHYDPCHPADTQCWLSTRSVKSVSKLERSVALHPITSNDEGVHILIIGGTMVHQHSLLERRWRSRSRSPHGPADSTLRQSCLKLVIHCSLVQIVARKWIAARGPQSCDAHRSGTQVRVKGALARPLVLTACTQCVKIELDELPQVHVS